MICFLREEALSRKQQATFSQASKLIRDTVCWGFWPRGEYLADPGPAVAGSVVCQELRNPVRVRLGRRELPAQSKELKLIFTEQPGLASGATVC